ncbi:flagellar hook-basal body complex protein FliE [Roseomonas sp. SSH11]|uniref:Flagellar hook-basal body complex protein FliE n=1 Tax=Pararoseomonas baculiformis TaxID=2820812 RepID=A0ABS4AGT1_9PROT|nr:flagellar hook-basal body complex protein FliE [Pararoseomonas baculiformis]MBP0446234.1 flagellar hook-basal body complex protein FliE [Pararoseomonas baculiformis]
MPAAIGAAGAAAAYRNATSPAAASAEGFGGALKRALEGAVESGRQADQAAAGALLGQASVTETVLAVSRAELALQTAVAVRDRVVSAYQDVMRMPI